MCHAAIACWMQKWPGSKYCASDAGDPDTDYIADTVYQSTSAATVTTACRGAAR